MIERLRREHPEKPILLSFFSPSGFEVRKNYPFVDAVVYLPFDTPKRVRRFLDAARPSMAIFIKYEFWGNYLHELRRRGIPTYIISSIFRPGQRFFRSIGGMFRKMLRCFDRLYVQDERSRRLLKVIGVENVTVAGDTRFDRVTDVMRSTVDIPGFPGFGEQFPLRFIAGSSWEADEDVYAPWLNSHENVAFIIAPHEFTETRLEALRNRFNAPVVLLSEWTREIKRANLPNGQIPDYLKSVRGIIIDSFGKLSSLYRYADMAYIGGGFGAGIHNLNEAAVYGIPVIFGPNHVKFKEAADLLACGGGLSIATKDHVIKSLNEAVRRGSGKVHTRPSRRNRHYLPRPVRTIIKPASGQSEFPITNQLIETTHEQQENKATRNNRHTHPPGNILAGRFVETARSARTHNHAGNPVTRP